MVFDLSLVAVPIRPMAVDSPPGNTIPSIPSNSSIVRTYGGMANTEIRRNDLAVS